MQTYHTSRYTNSFSEGYIGHLSLLSRTNAQPKSRRTTSPLVWRPKCPYSAIHHQTKKLLYDFL